MELLVIILRIDCHHILRYARIKNALLNHRQANERRPNDLHSWNSYRAGRESIGSLV